MGEYLKLIFDWSEAWAPLIPLTVLFFHRRQPPYLKAVIIYLWFAFFINTAGDIISDYKMYLPDWLQSNNALYNIHSVIRFICFNYFFTIVNPSSFKIPRNILSLLCFILMIANFTYVDNFFNPDQFSGNLLATEAYLLLVYCMFYYLTQLKDETEQISNKPDFWVVTGLSIYVVTNFFVFLFYIPMLKDNITLAINIWNVHNAAFIIFCIFIAKAFYEPFRYQYSV